MLLKMGTLKLIGCVAAAVVVPTAVVGGYFLIGSSDKYRGFSTNPLNDGVASMVNAYRGAVQQGAETIIAPGFNHAQPISDAFQQDGNFFKDIGFLLLDSNMGANVKASPNTFSVAYRTDLGSIQVGIAAAYFLNFYQDVFLSNGNGDDSLTYAMWGGQFYASVTSFMGGFKLGIDWANANLIGKTINGHTYKQVFRLGDDKTPKVIYDDLTGGFGPADGIDKMRNIIKDRPDILMPVAGPQVWTASESIALTNSKTVLVGVDSAVEEDSRNPSITFKDNKGNQVGNGKRVQFSSLKKLDRSVESALNIFNNGNKIPAIDPADPNRYKQFSINGTEGDVSGYGNVAVGNSENGCVGVSEGGIGYFKDAVVKGIGYFDDPSDNPEYDIGSIMRYVGYKETYDYSHTDNPFGLVKDFYPANETGIPNLDKKGFLKFGDERMKTKFKIILSSANSILMDASFSQSCYVGLYIYLKSQGINIPPPVGGKE